MRSQLKQWTTKTHALLDQRMSMLVLADRSDYATFLQTHHAAYAILSMGLPSQHWISATLHCALTDLSADLGRLGVDSMPLDGLTPKDDIHPLAIAYVVAGSHFGKHILHRRWSRSDDDLVLSAGAYLSNTVLKDAWARLMSEFETIPTPDQAVQQLGPDADWVFVLFMACLARAQEQGRAHAAA